MARKPRLHVPGGFYHVMLRGNGGQDIFFAKADRRYLYELLAEGSERFGYRVHGLRLKHNFIHPVNPAANSLALDDSVGQWPKRHAPRPLWSARAVVAIDRADLEQGGIVEATVGAAAPRCPGVRQVGGDPDSRFASARIQVRNAATLGRSAAASGATT